MTHTESHPLAGKLVRLNESTRLGRSIDPAPGDVYEVEDWWDKLTKGSWMTAKGNPAALCYALRAGRGGLPLDDEVVYGKIGNFGHIVHVSELGDPL